MLSMRARRIDNEWHMLEALELSHADRVRVQREEDAFALEVSGFPALRRPPSCNDDMSEEIADRHRLRIAFPRYYPTMAAEVSLDVPMFHPNVDPVNGFVCLWAKHRVQTTLVQSLAQLQRVLAWVLLNSDAEHVMQRDALDWYKGAGVAGCLPLGFSEFIPLQSPAADFGATPLRRRLS